MLHLWKHWLNKFDDVIFDISETDDMTVWIVNTFKSGNNALMNENVCVNFPTVIFLINIFQVFFPVSFSVYSSTPSLTRGIRNDHLLRSKHSECNPFSGFIVFTT